MAIQQVSQLILILVMTNNTGTLITVEAWAEIVVKEWLKKAAALNIPQGYLLNSFYSHVQANSNGDPSRVFFVFEWYGNMVDWGVGKGVTIANRDMMISAGLTKRRQKPFITDVFYKQLAVLRHLLEEKNAMNMERFIVNNITNNKA